MEMAHASSVYLALRVLEAVHLKVCSQKQLGAVPFYLLEGRLDLCSIHNVFYTLNACITLHRRPSCGPPVKEAMIQLAKRAGEGFIKSREALVWIICVGHGFEIQACVPPKVLERHEHNCVCVYGGGVSVCGCGCVTEAE
eukprot:1160320-Pelagomonas_calceolata.AAC.7